MKLRKIVLYVLLAAFLLFGGYRGYGIYQHHQAYEITDDAAIDGNIVPVTSRIGGYVKEVRVTENQIARSGQLLVAIDSIDLVTRCHQAEAALEAAKAQLAVAKANLQTAYQAKKSAEVALEIPRTNIWKAEKEYNRYHELYEQNLATPQQIDQYQATLETAKSQMEMAKQSVAAAQEQVQTAQAQIKVAEANVVLRDKDVENARLQLTYTRINAPVDGIVSKDNIQPGQLIQPGQPLMSLVDNQQVWVTANFKETQMQGIEIGKEVLIHVDAYPELDVTGEVESLSAATGSKFSLIPPDNATGNFVKMVQRIPVRIAIHHNEETLQKLKPGMSVNVEVKK
ncbi:MAG: HlyD family secretion protein [Saprospiraceae bacterium]|nr:HlyD family secretion protein [Saprospiraceae bacterium]